MIVAVVGPSGAGKDTLLALARARRPDLRVIRRVITRPPEQGGEDFESVTTEEFLRRKERGIFALDWEAHGLRYGIPKAALSEPGPKLFNGSRAILTAARGLWPDLRVILVTAPDEVLARRLVLRGREPVEAVTERLRRATFALPEGIPFATVMNDGTPEAGAERFLRALQPVRA